MSSHTLAWAGVDPVRTEAAHIVLGTADLQARGASLTADHALDWRLTTGPEFVTRRLSVRARGDGWARALRLDRSEADGTWTAVRTEAGPDGRDGAEERLDTSGLDEALDCDLQ